MDTDKQFEQARLTELIAAIQSGDREALCELHDLTAKYVYAIAMAITQSHADADELVSDVYMQVWRDVAKFEPARGNVRAWLTTITRSRSLDLLRRNRSRAENHASYALQADRDQPSDSTAKLLQLAGPETPLYSALMELPEERREVIALVYLHGLTHSEIAAHTGLPVGTVKSHIKRALLQLHGLLDT